MDTRTCVSDGLYDLLTGSNKDLEYQPPLRTQLRPRFNKNVVVTLLEALEDREVSHPEMALIEHHLKVPTKGYYFSSRYIAMGPLIASIVLAIFALESHNLYIYLSNSIARGDYAEVAMFGMYLIIIVSFGCAKYMHVDDADFYRYINKAEKVAGAHYSYEYRLVRCANAAGQAARGLFIYLQGGRRSWVPSPAVTDRALKYAYTLIDVDLIENCERADAEQNLHRYAVFLHYAASLVAVDRADLLPRLRDRFADLGIERRPLDENGDIRQRESEYLNPLGQHNRWSIISSYVYPLGTWFSFLVALVAFIVNLLR
ncbi:hypothetical protein [Saccharopolyspora rosea]|uniref:hypothetical protein n=1 Tax=Saccharopolyspora rosea TaxID=524884 RepID=UPI0021D8B423|nr:hypothetical protein [Saccharopolyspora rosea]